MFVTLLRACSAQLLPIVVALSEDRSWRARWSVANKLSELCEAFGPEATSGPLVLALEKLLKDPEAEVRTAAATKITDVAKRIRIELVMDKVCACVRAWLACSPLFHLVSSVACLRFCRVRVRW